MKQTVKRLTTEIPDLKLFLIELRKDKKLSYKQISDYLLSIGYKLGTRAVENLYKKLNILIERSPCGELNSFYGKKHKEETKEKISKTRKSLNISKGKNNYFYGKSGENSPAWKGGISSKKALFYSSEDWANKRFEIMNRDSFTCGLCGRKSNNERNIFNVHHIIPLRLDWNLRLENTNLITLCEDCHKKTFGLEEEFIPIFQDIVRATWRHVELDRNDLAQEEILE